MLKKWFSKETVNADHKKQRDPPKVQGIISVKPVDVLLEHHKGHITQINEIVGLSATHFDRYYLSAIRHYARFVQQLPASEVHHHAGLGGMLTHAIEVSMIALKVRRSYLLSETGGAEEISQKQDLWTYAVFIAALCHDLAKVAVDQVLTIYDENHHQHKWEPWGKYIDELGQWYTSEFVRNRQYRLHEKATPLLIYKIIPSHCMKWISSDQTIFTRWLASLSGDMDNASSIGEIISIADSQSVASNLGAENSRMATVKTKPLHEKMLTALRHLLMEGELPLNRNGAAGWVKDDTCWLVSKRTVDAIRDQLTQEGHSGVPTKNGRMFDILQEHSVIVPYGDKAIWSATIEGKGWSNDLTLLKVAVNKIWTNPAQRPDDFDGRVVTAEIKELGGKTEKVEQNIVLNNTPQEKVVSLTKSKGAEIIKECDTDNSSLEKIVYDQLEPLKQEFLGSLEDESDLLAFLPSINTEQTDNEVITTDVLEINLDKSKKTANKIKSEAFFSIHNNSKVGEGHNHLSLPGKNDSKPDQVILFFEWIQNGIKSGGIKTNQPKARVHVVNEGVILITPSIFQDFARSLNEKDTSKWTVIQQKVLKKNWHVRNEKGLNVVKYQVKGKSKTTTINAVLFQDVSKVFGLKEPPASNPHFVKVN